MRVVKWKVSHKFLTDLIKGEIDLEGTELPEDLRVVGVKGRVKDEWFYLYLRSKEYLDIDTEYDKIPELTQWFGHRRKDAKT